MAHVQWRKSSFSGSGGTGRGELRRGRYVELTASFVVRDSKNPGAGMLSFSRADLAACKAGEFDNLGS